MQGEQKDLAEKMDANSKETIRLDEETAVLKTEYNKIKGNLFPPQLTFSKWLFKPCFTGDPEKFKKQSEVVQIASKNLDEEMAKLTRINEELDRELNMQAKKKKVWDITIVALFLC